MQLSSAAAESVEAESEAESAEAHLQEIPKYWPASKNNQGQPGKPGPDWDSQGRTEEFPVGYQKLSATNKGAIRAWPYVMVQKLVEDKAPKRRAPPPP